MLLEFSYFSSFSNKYIRKLYIYSPKQNVDFNQLIKSRSHLDQYIFEGSGLGLSGPSRSNSPPAIDYNKQEGEQD